MLTGWCENFPFARLSPFIPCVTNTISVALTFYFCNRGSWKGVGSRKVFITRSFYYPLCAHVTFTRVLFVWDLIGFSSSLWDSRLDSLRDGAVEKTRKTIAVLRSVVFFFVFSFLCKIFFLLISASTYAKSQNPIGILFFLAFLCSFITFVRRHVLRKSLIRRGTLHF